VQQIRANYHLSQSEFATLLGIRRATLQNWEQGCRSPQAPARVLVQVAARRPDAIWDVVQPKKSFSAHKSAAKKTTLSGRTASAFFRANDAKIKGVPPKPSTLRGENIGKIYSTSIFGIRSCKIFKPFHTTIPALKIPSMD
jgi:transcriptional regulator with XRE-family HTH domain